jgi:hypothetical protein
MNNRFTRLKSCEPIGGIRGFLPQTCILWGLTVTAIRVSNPIFPLTTRPVLYPSVSLPPARTAYSHTLQGDVYPVVESVLIISGQHVLF